MEFAKSDELDGKIFWRKLIWLRLIFAEIDEPKERGHPIHSFITVIFEGDSKVSLCLTNITIFGDASFCFLSIQ